MTDAPRATPPTPDRAGWFEDPDDREQLRYFDGIIWSNHTTPRRTVWHVPPASEGGGSEQAPPVGQQGAPTAPHIGREAPPTGTSDQPAAGPYGYPAQPPHTQPPHTQPPHAQPPHAQPPHTQASAGQPWGQPNPAAPQVNPYHAPPPANPYQQHRSIPAGPTTQDGVPLAAMASRFAAWLIDSALTWLIGLVLGGVLLWRGLGNYPQIVADAVNAGTTAPADATALAEQIQFDLVWLGAFAVLQMLVGVAYHTFFLSRSGATPGRRTAGISVRLAERPGVLSPADAMRRSLLRPVLFLFTYTPGLGLFAMPLSLLDAVSAFWHPQRQTLHDRIGRTVVVNGPQPQGNRQDIR